MKNIKLIITIIVILVLVIGGVLLVKKRKEEIANLPTPKKPVYVVNGAVIKRGEIKEFRNFIGKVEADNKVNISTKLAGYIVKLYITEGQKVKKGDIIAIIDDKPVKLSIQSLRTNIETLNSQLRALKTQQEALKVALETARNIYNRDLKLYEKKAISKEKLELSKTNYEKAKANYNQVLANIKDIKNKIKQTEDQIKIKQNDLRYTIIKSPVDGVVSKVLLKEGNLAITGKPIAVIETSKNYKILFSFPAGLNISKGTEVFIKSEKGELKTEILKIYPNADNNGLSIAEIRVDTLPEDIKVGSFVNLAVLVGKAKGFIVPNNSILHLTGKSYIIITKGGKFVKIPIKILASNEYYSVIESPQIEEGLQVAVAEESKLKVLAMGVKGKIILESKD